MLDFSTLVNSEVEQVWVWWSLRLVFDLGPPGEPGTYVDVTEFRFTDPDGRVHSINVEEDPMPAGSVLAVLHRRVTAASIKDWELTLEFDNGAALVCPPHPKWEAWQASLGSPEQAFFCPIGVGPDSPD
jgi:hypothetical protein